MPVTYADSTLNYNKLNPAFEGRYYLKAGKVIEQKTKGRKCFNYPEKENVGALIEDSKSYVIQLKKARLKK